MANPIEPTIVDSVTMDPNIYVTWDISGKTVVATDYFRPVEVAGAAELSVHIVGAAGAGGINGATIEIEGSNKATPDMTTATDWVTIADKLGAAATFTAADLRQLNVLPRWIRPRISAGTIGTAASVILSVKKRSA